MISNNKAVSTTMMLLLLTAHSVQADAGKNDCTGALCYKEGIAGGAIIFAIGIFLLIVAKQDCCKRLCSFFNQDNKNNTTNLGQRFIESVSTRQADTTEERSMHEVKVADNNFSAI